MSCAGASLAPRNGRSTPPTGLACDAVLRTDNYDPRPALVRRGRSAAPDLVVGLCRFHDAALTVTLANRCSTSSGPSACGRHLDIPLTALTEFVRGRGSAVTGVAFIVERDGALDCHLDASSPVRRQPGQLVRLRASESANPLVRQAWEQLRANVEPTGNTVRGVEIARYHRDGDDGRVHMSAIAQRDSAGLDWTMVAVPHPIIWATCSAAILQNVAIGLAAVGLPSRSALDQ